MNMSRKVFVAMVVVGALAADLLLSGADKKSPAFAPERFMAA